MLDIRFLRENPEVVKQNIKNKFQDSKLPLVDEVIALDLRNREIKQEVEALRAEKLESRLILQVHDELLIETAKGEEDKVAAILSKCMKEAADLSVELAIDMHTGSDWYEAK